MFAFNSTIIKVELNTILQFSVDLTHTGLLKLWLKFYLKVKFVYLSTL